MELLKQIQEKSQKKDVVKDSPETDKTEKK
jgi:hypothetical protein